MAILASNTTAAPTPAPGALCRTAADVRARTAQVQAFRARVWPLQRPSLPPAPAPLPAKPAPALALQPRSEAVPGRITVRLVFETAAAHFGVPVLHLLSDIRTQPLCRHRQIAMYVAHRTTGRALAYIGRRIDRDHTTVLHACRVVQALVDAGDAKTVEAVIAITAKLQGGAQ